MPFNTQSLAPVYSSPKEKAGARLFLGRKGLLRLLNPLILLVSSINDKEKKCTWNFFFFKKKQPVYYIPKKCKPTCASLM